MYICDKCGKEWSDIDAEENESSCTRRCGGTLVAKTVKSSLDGALIDRLPFPIAYPWSKSLDSSLHSVQRLNNLIFTAYQAMRLTGLLLLSDYLESDGNCVSLGRPLAKMRMPHWGEWKTLTDSLAKYLAGKNDKYPAPSNSVCASLAATWISLGKAWAKDERSAPFAEGKKIPSPMEIFQILRNSRAHGQGVQDERGDEAQLLERHLPLLEFTLEKLFGQDTLQLFRLPLADSAEAATIHGILDDPLADHIPLISLHGVHENFQFEVEYLDLSESLREVLRKSFLAASFRGRLLPVYPFFLALDLEGQGSGGLLEPVSMVDAFSEKKVVHLGVHTYGPVEGLGAQVVELLGRKNHQLGLSREEADRWLMVEWARDNAINTVQNMTMHKYFPQCYLERAADLHLRAAGQHPGKTTVLAGEAGSGKSSLLCRLVEDLLEGSLEAEDGPARQKHFEKKVQDKDLAEESARDAYLALKGSGDVVIFLSGRSGIPVEREESLERAFCRALLRACGVKESEFNTALDFMKRLDENVSAAADSHKHDDNQDRRVWIILDALNEIDRFPGPG